MTYEIAVETVSTQPAAVIRLSVTREAIPAFLGGAFPELLRTLQEQGLPIAGPPFARYGVGSEQYDVTAGFPVVGAVTPVGRVETGELPGGEIATTMHVGPYEGLPGAFQAVTEWIQASGREIAGEPWESYLDGPEVPEPRTRVCFPMVTR